MPHPENYIDDDVTRIRDALTEIDADIAAQIAEDAKTNLDIQALQITGAQLDEKIQTLDTREKNDVGALMNKDAEMKNQITDIYSNLTALPTVWCDPSKIFANPTSEQWGLRMAAFYEGTTTAQAGKTPLWELYEIGDSQWYNVLTFGTLNRLSQLAVQAHAHLGQRMFLRCRHVDNNDMTVWQPWQEVVTVSMTKEDDGKVLCVELINGFPRIALKPVGGGAMRSELFMVPGTHTWTVPDRVTEVYVTMCGGGGGGSCTAYSYISGGGGSGDCLVRQRINVTPKTTHAITVGNGGAKSPYWEHIAGSGQTTSFGTLLSCAGGQGGAYYGGGSAGGAGGSNGNITAGGEPIVVKAAIFMAGVNFSKNRLGCGGNGTEPTLDKHTDGFPGFIIIEYL